MVNNHLVGGDWNHGLLWLSRNSWEWNNHLNWRTPSFFRGVGIPVETTNQSWFHHEKGGFNQETIVNSTINNGGFYLTIVGPPPLRKQKYCDLTGHVNPGDETIVYEDYGAFLQMMWESDIYSQYIYIYLIGTSPIKLSRFGVY